MRGMDKPSKLPPLPILLTGNDLRFGQVVYYTGDDWCDAIAGALVAPDEAAARRLEAVAAGSEGAVVNPQLVTATLDANGRAGPAHYREAIRAGGPTVDYGEGA